MKKSTLLLALALSGLLVSTASAQVFVGSDNFDSGFSATKWDAVYRLNSATQGNLDFTNSRLDFSKAATGAGNQHRLWNSDGNSASSLVTATSFTNSWVMNITATNTLTVSGSDFATIGIQVFNDNNSYSALMLSSTNTGNYVRAEGIGFTAVNSLVVDNTDVTLRLSWDATAQTLAAAYSLDGSSFTSVATFLPTSQWNNTSPYGADAGFNFGVFGNSNTTAAISVGNVYADNFAVSAIPEPSTYAAFAGLGALGLAFWRRRQTRATARA